MNKSIFTKTLTLVLTSTALSMATTSIASANVMYNTYNQYAANIGTDSDANGTDGWTYPEFNSPRSPSYAWVGTDGNALPFGLNNYDLPFANWAVHLNNPGSSATVSSQNAHDSYGIWADIDTTKGAWNDGGPNGTNSSSNGTIYNMDLGLFKSDITQQVTLTVSNSDPSSWQNFGINVYSGTNQMRTEAKYVQTGTTCCDRDGNPIPTYSLVKTNLADIRHYGYWNRGYIPDTNTAPAEHDNPFGSYIQYLTHGDQSTVTFSATAGEVYAILLGGYSGEGMYSNDAGYAVNITASPVPVPCAFWLFGSVLAGLMGIRLKKVS